jgi:hypothetical protein
VKIGAGINIYKPQDELDDYIYDQIQKYEDCIGLPVDKIISIFTLTQDIPKTKNARYRYYKQGINNIRWYEIYRLTNQYHLKLQDNTCEKCLLDHYIRFLKEENMAGFQGFTLRDLAEMSRLVELTGMLEQHRKLIKSRIKITGLKESEEHLSWDRDGIFYKSSSKGKIGIFIGLWFSDEIYDFKVPQENGPRAVVFLEIPPQNPIRNKVLKSDAYRKAGNVFDQKNVGYQILLRSKPLIDFLGKEDQVSALLYFYQESTDTLQQSGIIDLILSSGSK